MRLGLDFDNTIVCYDELFHRLAAERSLVPPPTGGVCWSKSQVRDHLRAAGREDDWTRLQGEAYGPRIVEASPFPGVLDFISLCRRESIPVFVISHKTKRPFIGEPHDLHAAAIHWLEHHGFFAPALLSRGDVFLEETKERKLARIAKQRCSHFVDDLAEILNDPAFPAGVGRVLFAPGPLRDVELLKSAAKPQAAIESVHSWARLTGLLFQEVLP